MWAEGGEARGQEDARVLRGEGGGCRCEGVREGATSTLRSCPFVSSTHESHPCFAHAGAASGGGRGGAHAAAEAGLGGYLQC